MRRPGYFWGRTLKCKALLTAAAIILFVAALYAVGREFETGTGQPDVRGKLKEQTQGAADILYEGAIYEPKELTKILLMGIDKGLAADAGGLRNGGQADFLLLLLIDHEEKKIVSLQIDRDTMAQITVLGVLGNDAGTREAQICLSHGFGDGKAQSCLLTLQAVSELLGVTIDDYIAMDLDGIRVLNDSVGGVTVTLEDDFSALDPAMAKGATIRLNGVEAEYYVRNRMEIGIGTNEARMERQKIYLEALQEKIREQYRDDSDFPEDLYKALEPYLQTDIKRGRILNEVWRTRDYAYSEIVRPEGTHAIGKDGFMEFYPDEAALRKLVVDLFYRAKQ